MALRDVLDEAGISQADLARGLDLNPAFISRLARGECGASMATVRSLLAFLSAQLGRQVTYEEAFGGDDPPALDQGEAGDTSIEIEAAE